MKFKFIKILLILMFLSTTVFTGQWSVPVVVCDRPASIGDMNFDKNDRLHLVFSGQVNDTSTYDIFYTFSDGDSFAIPINLSNSQKISYKAKLVVDNDNVIHVVWEDYDERQSDLFYSYCKNGKWSVPMNFWHGDTSYNGVTRYFFISNLVLDSSGRVHFMLYNETFSHYTFFENGIPPDIQNVDTPLSPFYSNIYIDNHDTLHIVAEGHEIILGSVNSGLFYFYYSKSDSAWCDPVMVYQSKGSYFPKIIGDVYGRLHIIWLEDIDNNYFPDRIYHSFSDDGIYWIEPYIVYKSEQNCFRLDVAMDSQNQLHAVWDHTNQPNSLFIDHVYYSFFDGTSWAEPEKLTLEGTEIGGNPSIAIDSQDYLHVVWIGPLNEQADMRLIYTNTRPSTNVVSRESSTPVSNFSLSQNFPNPFNTTTRICFSIPSSEQVALLIYDINGKTVKKLLASTTLSPGIYEIMWDGTDSQEQQIASGVYFCVLKAESQHLIYTKTRKIVLLK